ncbi:MAG: hypothetical protein Q4F21_15475 [Lachnospiraceae bacterium]|nr:hypothetical protein [Lachnospiraceae bacterium]
MKPVINNRLSPGTCYFGGHECPFSHPICHPNDHPGGRDHDLCLCRGMEGRACMEGTDAEEGRVCMADISV